MAESEKSPETSFQPYVSAEDTRTEFTPRAILLGGFFGLLFGAVTVYVGLRAGLTVAASIPIAVLSISILRALRLVLPELISLVLGGVAFAVVLVSGVGLVASILVGILVGIGCWFVTRKLRASPTILENNIVQTTGSAGESIAGGVIFTLPALIFLGFPLEYSRIFLLTLIGGWLGVFFMIPLRRQLIVKEHANLLYPEGTDRKSTRLNSSHIQKSRMPSSA